MWGFFSLLSKWRSRSVFLVRQDIVGLLVSVVCRTASLVWELLEGDNGREFEIGFPIQGTGTVPGIYWYCANAICQICPNTRIHLLPISFFPEDDARTRTFKWLDDHKSMVRNWPIKLATVKVLQFLLDSVEIQRAKRQRPVQSKRLNSSSEQQEQPELSPLTFSLKRSPTTYLTPAFNSVAVACGSVGIGSPHCSLIADCWLRIFN